METIEAGLNPATWIASMVTKHPQLMGWLIFIFAVRGVLALVFGAVANRYKSRNLPVPMWVEIVNDVLSGLPRPGQWGVFGPVNMPGVPSLGRKPLNGVRVLLPLFLALGLTQASCTPEGKRIAWNMAACAAGKVPGIAMGLLGQTLSSLTNAQGAPSWEDFAKTTLLNQGIDAAGCVVNAAVTALEGQIKPGQSPSPAVLVGIRRGRIWLDDHHVNPSASVIGERAKWAYASCTPELLFRRLPDRWETTDKAFTMCLAVSWEMSRDSFFYADAGDYRLGESTEVHPGREPPGSGQAR